MSSSKEVLAITSTRQSSCCFNEFTSSSLFMTPKHVLTAGVLCLLSTRPSAGESELGLRLTSAQPLA